MNVRLLERCLVGILLFIAVALAIHTPLTLWLGTMWPSNELLIKSWKEVLMGVALALLIVLALRKKAVDSLLGDRVMQLALMYAGLHFVMMAVFQNGLQAAGAGLLIDLRFVLYFVLVYGFLTLYPSYRRLFIISFAAGAVIILLFAALQVFVLPKDILAHIGYSKATIAPYLTVDENPDYIRINSTLRGPNPLGAYAVICLGVLAAFALRWKLQARAWLYGGVVAFAALVALWVSYSRSSVLAGVVAVGLIIVATASSSVRNKLLVGIGTLLVVVSGLLFAFRDTSFVANVVLHNSPTTGAHIDSNSGHAESLADGFNRMLAQPFGAGVGSTGSASLLGEKPLIIENQYLLIAHEVGWVGIAVFIWLFVEVMKRLWLRRQSALALGVFGSGAGLAIIGLLLPVWVDDTVSIVWWGLAAIAIAGDIKMTKGARRGTRTSN